MCASHSGSSFVPQQRMLRFTSHKTKAAAYFNLKPSKLKEHTYTMTVTPNTIDKQIGSQVTLNAFVSLTASSLVEQAVGEMM